MKKYTFTLIGLTLSGVIFFTSVLLDFDLFESVLTMLHSLEEYELDEAIIPIFIFLLFAVFDLYKREKQQAFEYEKIKIYKAMLASTHHILNNFLNQMQLFKITADETPGYDPEILASYDAIIQSASTQIDALGSISDIDEKSILDSVLPK